MPNAALSPATESIALRAFALLEQVVRASGPMSLDEITLALGLPKATVFRIVNLLKEAGLLRREDDRKRYTVGPRLTSFAIALWQSAALRAQWHSILEDVVEEIGESCNLTMLEGNKVLYIDRVETRQALRLHLEVGTRVPLHCTASGKLFLSRMTDEQLRNAVGDPPYEKFARKTITTMKALQQDLARVRATGVGTHDCELFDDSVAIAVPVTSLDGSVIAAVAMHAPITRATLKSCLDRAGVLREAAARIAQTLTVSPSPAPQKRKPRSG